MSNNTLFSNKLFFNDPKVRSSLILSAILVLSQWILLGVFSWQLPPEIPLFYSHPPGATQLANRNWFLFLPIISLLILLVNLLLIRLSANQKKIYLQLLGWFTTLILFLIVVAMIHVISIVL